MSQIISLLAFCFLLAVANSEPLKRGLTEFRIGEKNGEKGGPVFYMSTFKATWKGALDYCVLAEGLNFMYMTSRQLNLELLNHVDENDADIPYERMWIAGQESETMDNRFLWHYNSQEREFVYTNWAIGEPTISTQQSCVDIIKSERNQDGFIWRTNSCDVKQYFICVGV